MVWLIWLCLFVLKFYVMNGVNDMEIVKMLINVRVLMWLVILKVVMVLDLNFVSKKVMNIVVVGIRICIEIVGIEKCRILCRFVSLCLMWLKLSRLCFNMIVIILKKMNIKDRVVV